MVGLLKSIVRHRIGIERGPYLCVFLPTLRCNARCQACGIWGREEVGEEMTLAEIRALFDQMTDLTVVKVTGGEPFLRRDLPQILDYFLNERKLMVQVTSNGLLTDRIVRTVRDLACTKLHVCISLDGVGKFVDDMRGIPGCYETVLKTLEELAQIGEQKSYFLAVNQTIFYRDPSQGAKLMPVLARIGVENVHYNVEHNLFDPAADEAEKKNYWRDVRKDHFSQVNEAVKRLAFKDGCRDIVYKYYFKGLENRVLRGLKKPDFECTALNSYFRLAPCGDVLTCAVITEPVANLRNADFAKVWESPKIERARKVVQECEGCWFGCEVVPNATISGDIIKGLFYRR
jgi:MoaA/NifB/PqqE/SkfB family radical SAM enzyme